MKLRQALRHSVFAYIRMAKITIKRYAKDAMTQRCLFQRLSVFADILRNKDNKLLSREYVFISFPVEK